MRGGCDVLETIVNVLIIAVTAGFLLFSLFGNAILAKLKKKKL